MIYIVKFLATLLIFFSGMAAAQSDDLKAFPLPVAGMQRVVFSLPDNVLHDDLKVEVIVGKTIEVDCNLHFFMAKVESKIAQGWGFPYYVISDWKGPAATMRACAEDEKTSRKFVRANLGEWGLLRYNSKLPIVIYVPEGTEVRYRIWQAQEDVKVN